MPSLWPQIAAKQILGLPLAGAKVRSMQAPLH
jgi:hypothetical protein